MRVFDEEPSSARAARGWIYLLDPINIGAYDFEPYTWTRGCADLLDLPMASPARRDKVREYAAELRAGSRPPPIFLAYEHGRLVIWDGNHRIAAARALGADGPKCLDAFIGRPIASAGFGGLADRWRRLWSEE